MQETSEFERLEPAQKADAIRFAMDEFTRELGEIPNKFVALIFFAQLISDVEEDREPTPLTRKDLRTRVDARYPEKTTPQTVGAAPTRVAKALEGFVCRYPKEQ